MKFYIASRLENYAQVQAIAEKLKAAGWVHTYDWTNDWKKQSSVKSTDAETLKSVSTKEFKGVSDADVVIVLTPQGRGTHTEFGMAIALNKTVFLCHSDNTYFKCDDNTSSFYYLPQVIRLIGSTEEIVETVLRYEGTV
jgi:nucleoside 2-deoxyribosyltransferase